MWHLEFRLPKNNPPTENEKLVRTWYFEFWLPNKHPPHQPTLQLEWVETNRCHLRNYVLIRKMINDFANMTDTKFNIHFLNDFLISISVTLLPIILITSFLPILRTMKLGRVAIESMQIKKINLCHSYIIKKILIISGCSINFANLTGWLSGFSFLFCSP